MKLAILAGPDSWYVRDLQRAAAGRHLVQAVPFSQLALAWNDGPEWTVRAEEEELRGFDAVLVRTMPPGSLEQVVFRMDVLHRLEASQVVVINPPRAIEAAVDKFLAGARMHAAGLPVPATVACQTVDAAREAFAVLGGDVVVKPLFGSEGRGMLRVNQEELAERVFKTLAQLQSVIYVQRFVPHQGHDVRLLIIGRQVLAMRRVSQGDWRTNVSQGATTEAFDPPPEWVDLACRAAAVVGAPVAGVDILPGIDGRAYVLEVNAVPGWKSLAQTLRIDVAARVLEFVARQRGREGTEPWVL